MDITSRVRRTVLVVVVGVVMVVTAASPGWAAGVWDPNDAGGRLDIRWVGMRYVGADEAIVTLVMYPTFRRQALPKPHQFRRRSMIVSGDAFMSGYYFRKHGHIRLSWGDHASGCCEVVAVHRPNRTTLVARVHPYHFGDEGEPGIQGYATSRFRIGDESFRDRTKVFRLPPR